MTYKIDSHKMS